MSLQSNTRHRLINLLAIALFAALMFFLLLPAVQQPRSSRRTQCKNNLKNIGLALHSFYDDQRSFPQQRTGDPPQSWRMAILPYIDQAPLYNQYRLEHAWDSDENSEFSKTQISIFQCPQQRQHTDNQNRWLTSYALITGPQCIWRDNEPLTFQEIADGASNTIAVVEACGHKIVWNEPRDIDVTKTPLTITLAGHKSEKSPGVCSSYHMGGGHALLADGTVRFISQTIDPETLKALTTADGGETVGDF